MFEISSGCVSARSRPHSSNRRRIGQAPQGRHLPETLGLLGHQVDDVVDLLLGGEAAPRPKRIEVWAISSGTPSARSTYDGSTTPTCTPIPTTPRRVLERHHHGLALHEREADVEIARQAMLEGNRSARCSEPVLRCPCADAHAARGRRLPSAFHLQATELGRLAKPTMPVTFRVPERNATLVAATVDDGNRRNPRLATHVQRANSLGAIHLVGGQRHQICLAAVHVEPGSCDALDSIDVWKNAPPLFHTLHRSLGDRVHDSQSRCWRA